MISTGTLGDGLRLLAERVPTIIQQSLNPIVSGVEWPTVLKEVARRKGVAFERRQAPTFRVLCRRSFGSSRNR